MSPAPAPGPHRSLIVVGLPVVGGVTAGTDLAAGVLAAAGAAGEQVRSGDVVVVTSKAVSKAAGLVVTGRREALVSEHTDREVARRGATRIVRTRHGLVLAAAGLDESNTEPGTVVLLPPDPDGAAAALRASFATAGLDVAVVVTDTAGRAWRYGQTDLAIGLAGLRPLIDLAGVPDSHGVPLRVTAPAIADEVAAAADLVRGKTAGVPYALVRGLSGLLLPAGEDGPGARALVRPPAADLFGLGAVDAVRAAVRGDGPTDGFPTPEPTDDLAGLLGDATAAGDLAVRVSGHADGWTLQPGPGQSGRAFVRQAAVLVERLRVLGLTRHRLVDADWPDGADEDQQRVRVRVGGRPRGRDGAEATETSGTGS